jgi:hypothetical protein
VDEQFNKSGKLMSHESWGKTMCHISASRAPKAARTGIRKFHEQSMVYDDGAPKKKAGKGRGATPAGPLTPPCEAGLAGLAVRQASKGQSAHEPKSCCACCGTWNFPRRSLGWLKSGFLDWLATRRCILWVFPLVWRVGGNG